MVPPFIASLTQSLLTSERVDIVTRYTVVELDIVFAYAIFLPALDTAGLVLYFKFHKTRSKVYIRLPLPVFLTFESVLRSAAT